MTDYSSQENGIPLLFHWKQPKTLFSIRLLAATVAAVVIHGFCFYVFQVEEPAARRILPRTHAIIMLSAQDPHAAGLLRQVEDYYAGFEGTLNLHSPLQVSLDALPETRPRAASVPEIRPLHPSFNSMEPRQESAPSPRLAALPETPEYEPSLAGDLEGLRLVLCPALEERGWLREAPSVSFDDPAALAPTSGEVSWRVAVAPSGRVEFVFPLRVSERPELAELTNRLRRSQFQPEPGSDLQWGTISLQW